MTALARIAATLLITCANTLAFAAEEPAAPASAPTAPSAKPLPAKFAQVGRGAEVGTSFSSTCWVSPTRTIPPGANVIVVRKATCTPPGGSLERLRYEVIYKGETYLAEPRHFPFFDLFKKDVDAYPEDRLSASSEAWRLASLEIALSEVESTAKALRATKKHGIALVRSGIHDVSEHTEGTGASFVVANTTDKTIKYVTVSYVGLNAVGDPVRPLRGTAFIRGVGPIEPGKMVSYSRDYVWHTDLVESHRVSSIAVEYMDGTKRTISDVKAIALTPLQASIALDEE